MAAPLADRIRPQSLDEMVGQQHLLGPNGLLRRIAQSGTLPNLIFYGPSGVGKTTAARIIAAGAGKKLYRLNGTTASTGDIKALIADLGGFDAMGGVVLYLDEIQYLNKKQQQTLLEYIEDGSITLIASTTENPYFYVYNAILSRCTVFEFKPVDAAEVERYLESAMEKLRQQSPELQVEEGAYAEAWLYLTVVCAGLLGTIGYNLNAGILGGLGNSRTTLLFLAIAAGMNIFLDLLLVLACGMGVLGVALGTVVSQAFSWLFGLAYINRRYPDIAIRPFCRRFDRRLFRQIMGIGLPAGIQMSLVAVGAMAVMSKINSYGKEFTAAYNVGSKLDQLAFLPVQSLSNAVTAFVGQNIGARRLDRARQGIRITVLSAVAWSAVMLVLIPLGPTLVGLFSSTPAVIEAGAVYLRCIMPFYVLFSVMFCLNNAMRGAGDSLFPMVDVIFSLILVRVPAVYWFAAHYGPDYMYYGVGVGWTLGFTLSVLYYFSGRWKHRGSLADP